MFICIQQVGWERYGDTGETGKEFMYISNRMSLMKNLKTSGLCLGTIL